MGLKHNQYVIELDFIDGRWLAEETLHHAGQSLVSDDTPKEAVSKLLDELEKLEY